MILPLLQYPDERLRQISKPIEDINDEIRELVKRLHPDANGGDRSREGTLQEILKAYQQLKSVGMV